MSNYEDFAYANLNGKYKHFCPYWDEMAIDEYCPEFESCLCYDSSDVEVATIKLNWHLEWLKGQQKTALEEGE